MVELAFRVFNDGANLVAVAFPSEEGTTDSAVLEQRWDLDSLGLAVTGTPPQQYNMPFDTWSVKDRTALERGGLEVVVNYEGERVSVTPLTRQGSRIDERTVRYRFKDLSVEDARTSDIQQAKDKARLRVRKEELPLDTDETWP